MNAIIIGASSGIGNEVARLLLQRGWHCGIAARRTEPLCGLAFGVKVYEYQQRYFAEHQPTAAVQFTDEDIDKYVNEVCDFTMLDAQDIYAYATTGE